MRLGSTELIVILLVVMVIFGPTQLPKLGKMFGKTMKNFKEGVEEMDEDEEEETPKKKSKKAAEEVEEDSEEE